MVFVCRKTNSVMKYLSLNTFFLLFSFSSVIKSSVNWSVTSILFIHRFCLCILCYNYRIHAVFYIVVNNFIFSFVIKHETLDLLVILPWFFFSSTSQNTFNGIKRRTRSLQRLRLNWVKFEDLISLHIHIHLSIQFTAYKHHPTYNTQLV